MIPSTDLCDAQKYLKTENQIVKRFISIAEHVLNPEAMKAYKRGCPIMVFDISCLFFINVYF